MHRFTYIEKLILPSIPKTHWSHVERLHSNDRIYYFRVFLGKPVWLCLIGHKRLHPLTLIRYRPNLTLPYSVLTSEVMSVVTPSHTKMKTPHTRQTLRKSTFIECYAMTLPSITTHSISIRFGLRIRRQLFLCLNGKTGWKLKQWADRDRWADFEWKRKVKRVGTHVNCALMTIFLQQIGQFSVEQRRAIGPAVRRLIMRAHLGQSPRNHWHAGRGRQQPKTNNNNNNNKRHNCDQMQRRQSTGLICKRKIYKKN